jgi:hypothetical protein
MGMAIVVDQLIFIKRSERFMLQNFDFIVFSLKRIYKNQRCYMNLK